MRRSFGFLVLGLILTCSHGTNPPAAVAPPNPAQCGPSGDAVASDVKAMNLLKNRETNPVNVNGTITLPALLQPGNDTARFSTSDGVELEAVVYDVLVGGVETANCHATDAANRDTHIELVLDGSHTAPAQRIISEVIPRYSCITCPGSLAMASRRGFSASPWGKVTQNV